MISESTWRYVLCVSDRTSLTGRVESFAASGVTSENDVTVDVSSLEYVTRMASLTVFVPVSVSVVMLRSRIVPSAGASMMLEGLGGTRLSIKLPEPPIRV
jgi:hypothetical protein